MRTSRDVTAAISARVALSAPSTYLYAIVAVAILAIGVSVLVVSARDRASELRQASGVVATLADVFVDYTDRLIQTADLVRNEATSIAVDEGTIGRGEGEHRAIAGLVARSPHVVSIWVGNAEGDALLTSRTFPTPRLNAADRRYFQAVRDDPHAHFIGLLPDNRFRDEVLIVTNRRITTDDGDFLGFVQVSLSPESIRSLVARTRLGFPISIYLFAPGGEVLLRDPPFPLDELGEVSLDTFLPAGASERGIFEAPGPIDGAPRIFGHARSSATGITTVVGMPSGWALSGWRGRLLVNILAGTAIAVALALLAALGAQALRRQKAYALDLEGRVEERTRALSAALGEKDLLIAEMGHRVKNAFATVQAVHRQSMRMAGDLDSYGRDFEGRLRALAAAHVLIAEAGPQEQVSLRALVEGELMPYATTGAITLEGPDVALDGVRALALALVVHELATNAAKYGALGVATGQISLSWQIDEGDVLALAWRERGGPPVSPPTRRGFGSRVLATSLSPHGGVVEIAYAPDGLAARIRLPLG